MASRVLRHKDLTDDEKSQLSQVVNARTKSEKIGRLLNPDPAVSAAKLVLSGGIWGGVQIARILATLVFENDDERELYIRLTLKSLAGAHGCDRIDISTFPSIERWYGVGNWPDPKVKKIIKVDAL